MEIFKFIFGVRIMRQEITWMLGLAASLLCSLPFASAQGFPSKNELMGSTWDSTYTTRSGQRVAATVQFDGRNGTYDTEFGQGRLSNIEYGVDTRTNPSRPFFQITGRWSFLGENGTFLFASNGGSAFKGSWTSNSGGGGRWDGQLSQPVVIGGGNVDQFVQVQVGVVYDRTWSYNAQKDYYYKKCSFPGGGYQYIIYYVEKPEWIYWYNPVKQVCWCACPTVKHPQWGRDVAAGKDLFLMATDKQRDPRDTTFPSDNGANFKTGATAKDNDGSDVNLGCPPTDLP
jgi:hypothetical protein